MIRLSLYFLLFALFIAVPPLLAGHMQMSQWLAPGFWFMYLFFLAATCIVCIVVIAGQQKSSTLGVQLFLIATVVKLLSCMIFSLIYLRNMPVKAPVFILSFFYLYFLNTAFEIFALLGNLRIQNKK